MHPKVQDRDEERQLLEKLGDALEDARIQLKRLWRRHEAEYGSDEEYLRDGSLTDAGRKRLNQMFVEGKRSAEIAALLGISDSAVAYHRKRWNQLQGARGF